MSIGGAACADTLRTALAMGADRALLVQSDDDLEPLAVAKVLRAVVEAEAPGLVILGKQAIDGDNNAVGQMLAGLAGLAAGDLRLEGAGERDRRRPGDAGGGRGPADPRGGPARR